MDDEDWESDDSCSRKNHENQPNQSHQEQGKGRKVFSTKRKTTSSGNSSENLTFERAENEGWFCILFYGTFWFLLQGSD